MNYVLAFLAGLLTSHWLEELLLRLLLRIPAVKETVRSHARKQGIDLREKGKIISLEALDAVQAASKPGSFLDNLDIRDDDEQDNP